MTASDFDHAYGFLLTRGRSPYMRRLAGPIAEARTLVADLSLDKVMLQDIVQKKV
jgi:hypothetical protein